MLEVKSSVEQTRPRVEPAKWQKPSYCRRHGMFTERRWRNTGREWRRTVSTGRREGRQDGLGKPDGARTTERKGAGYSRELEHIAIIYLFAFNVFVMYNIYFGYRTRPSIIQSTQNFFMGTYTPRLC